MATSIKPIPDGYHTVTPYLVIKDAAKAIEFYTEVFNAMECMRLPNPEGKLMHAEIRIGDSSIMLCDESPNCNAFSPLTIGDTAVSIMLYVEDVDAVVNRAVAAGAVLVMPVADQFWGDRMGSITDPFGHKWSVATHVEDVPPEEIRARVKALFDAQ
ncbi:MAG: VOC family protein [Desulfuromonadales bacterium]|nr:VOC family protein [Desulfuromonadales bacterium]